MIISCLQGYSRNRTTNASGELDSSILTISIGIFIPDHIDFFSSLVVVPRQTTDMLLEVPDTYGEGDVTRYDVRLSTHAWSPRETGIVAPLRSAVSVWGVEAGRCNMGSACWTHVNFRFLLLLK